MTASPKTLSLGWRSLDKGTHLCHYKACDIWTNSFRFKMFEIVTCSDLYCIYLIYFMYTDSKVNIHMYSVKWPQNIMCFLFWWYIASFMRASVHIPLPTVSYGDEWRHLLKPIHSVGDCLINKPTRVSVGSGTCGRMALDSRYLIYFTYFDLDFRYLIYFTYSEGTDILKNDYKISWVYSNYKQQVSGGRLSTSPVP